MSLTKAFANVFSSSQKNRLKQIMFKTSKILKGKNLNELAEQYGTDKWGSHFYTQHYEHHFKKFKNQKINLLEIGVGGFDDSKSGGNSLRMWKAYFPKANIYSVDIYDKSSLNEERIKIFQGSQIDEAFLLKIINEIGGLDIIIDDGSHINENVITTFNILFPLLKDGGIYAIEDTQTSYWPGFGGDATNSDSSKTSLNFLKKLTDGLNHKEFVIADYEPTYFDKKIISMHFYHNLVFVYKGNNNEKSNKEFIKKIYG